MTLSSFKSLQHVRLNSKKMMKNRMLLSYWKYLIWLSNINGYFWRILLFWKWSRTKRPKYPSPWNVLFSTGAGGAQTRRSFENHLLHPLILRFSLLNMCIRWFWGPELSFIEQTAPADPNSNTCPDHACPSRHHKNLNAYLSETTLY